MRVYVLGLALLLTGCSTATLETRLNKQTPYAPVNEINGGIVSYLNAGARSVVEARRRDAYKKMHTQCNGDYKIVEEGERLGTGMATPIGGTTFITHEERWNIRFECVH